MTMTTLDVSDLESALRASYGAYQYLRAHDLADVSATSRLLRAGDLAYLVGRVRDEMDELRGVIAGTHRHAHRPGYHDADREREEDIVLEAYQTLYWLTLLAVAAGDCYDDVRPHEAIAAAARAAGLTPAAFWGEPSCPTAEILRQRRDALREGFAHVSTHCRGATIPVVEPVRRDLRELRAKPYLAPYWDARNGLDRERS